MPGSAEVPDTRDEGAKGDFENPFREQGEKKI